MKIKRLLLIGLLSLTTSLAFSQYRVSRIEEQWRDRHYTTTFQYTGDQLTSYVEESPGTTGSSAYKDTYNLKYDKTKVIFLKDDKKAYELKFEKEGAFKESEYIELSYKKGVLKGFQEKDKANKYSHRYKMLDNELGHLSVVVSARSTYLHASRLIYNNEKGQCIRFLNIDQAAFTDSAAIHSEDATVEWENGRVKRISGRYRNGRSRVVLHEFFYNEHDLLCEEKVYVEGEDGKNKLERHFKITYEPGVGNADKVYMPYCNWTINILLGQQTFCSIINPFY